MDTIQITVKNYLLEEFVDEAVTGPIEADTPLLSSGIIDSISALQLVDFLEKTYGFSFQAHEVDQDNLDTITLITEFVQSKVGKTHA